MVVLIPTIYNVNILRVINEAIIFKKKICTPFEILNSYLLTRDFYYSIFLLTNSRNVMSSMPTNERIRSSHNSWHQKIVILIQMQFLNDIIKSEHGFKVAQNFQSFRVLIKTINL